jgi:hypothetical protein
LLVRHRSSRSYGDSFPDSCRTNSGRLTTGKSDETRTRSVESHGVIYLMIATVCIRHWLRERGVSLKVNPAIPIFQRGATGRPSCYSGNRIVLTKSTCRN